MTPEALAVLLQRLEPDLAGLSEPWTLIGSAALILAGAPWPTCEDVDILTSAPGAERLEQLWSYHRLADYRLDDTQPFRSRFSRYAFEAGAVEVMGDLHLRTTRGWAPVEVRETRQVGFAGGLWLIPSLEEQARILRAFGRPKDLQKLGALSG